MGDSSMFSVKFGRRFAFEINDGVTSLRIGRREISYAPRDYGFLIQIQGADGHWSDSYRRG
jgi:hypothetical protein